MKDVNVTKYQSFLTIIQDINAVFRKATANNIFLDGIHSCKVEKTLRGMELQEKEAQKG